MRIPKYVRIAGISLSILVILLVMFVAAFIFNPFEGRVTDMRDLVPRDIDFFVRKTDLARDFVELPEPVFWEQLARNQAWGQVRNGPTYASIAKGPGGAEASAEELRRVAEQIRSDSAGFLDLLRDVIGDEVIVTGRLRGNNLQTSQWCVLTRVSWRVRFLWGLVEWGSVRSAMAEQGIQLTAVPERDNVFVVSTPALREPLQLARIRDCLIISNDQSLVDAAFQLSQGNTEDLEGFGGSADYRDDILDRQREWDERLGLGGVNAIEAWIRPDRLTSAMRLGNDWPDPRAEDMNERVLAAFLEQEGWRFLTASTLFDPSGLTMLGKIELDPNRHTEFQRDFFKNEAQARSEWMHPFLSLVPEDAVAAAALRVPAGAFLRQMYLALDAPSRELLDDAIRRTGKYDSVLQLIDTIEIAFLPRTGFVFQRAVRTPDDPKTLEPSKLPHVAWVFWVREDAREILTHFQDFLFENHPTLGFTQAFNLTLRGSGGGDVAREYVNPQIPGTGSIALLLYGDFFVLSNYGPLLGRMVDARLSNASLRETEDYRTIEPELADKLNAFVYVNATRLRDVLGDVLSEMTSDTSLPDPGWMIDNRPAVERSVLGRMFPGVTNPATLGSADQNRFEEAVGAELQQRWNQAKSSFLQGDVLRMREAIALTRLFRSAYVQLEFGPQFLQWTAGLLSAF